MTKVARVGTWAHYARELLERAAAKPYPRRGVYTHICLACEHPCCEHLLADGGDLRDGPYVCEHCGCGITQDAPSAPLGRLQYRDWLDAIVRAARGTEK